MAYKIFRDENYFIIQDENNIEYEGLLKEVRVRRLTTTSEDFYFDNLNNWKDKKEGINISEIQDKDGVNYTLQSFIEFYRANTGNFNGGGENSNSPTFVTTAEMNALTPELGDEVFNTDTNSYWHFNGTEWIAAGGKKTQVFSLTRDWSTPSLNRAYYINYANNGMESRPVGTNNTIIDSLTGRNGGMFTAPYDCKIINAQITTINTGSFTGVFGVGSGTLSSSLDIDMTNKVVHIDEVVTSSGYFTTYHSFSNTDGVTIQKGDKVCPVLMFSAHASSIKYGVTIQIEIEKI